MSTTLPDRTTRRRARTAATALGVAIGVALALPAGAAPVGPPVDAGDAVVVDNTGRPLAGGGSSTAFRLDLPEGAACPGDSMHDQWLVQSFVIPAADDPGTIHYGVIGPDGESQYALYALDTRPFAHQLTRANSAPNTPGVIPGVPELSFAVFPPGTLADGQYRVGIACTYFRTTATYWDAEITVTSSDADEPAQFVWSVPNAPEGARPTGGEPSSTGWIALAVVASVAVVGGGAVVRRRRSTPSPLPTPTARTSR